LQFTGNKINGHSRPPSGNLTLHRLLRLFFIWAHFRRSAPETGLSACIFFACGKKGYRFYPLRGQKIALRGDFLPRSLPLADSNGNSGLYAAGAGRTMQKFYHKVEKVK
jgi:hypothetical protein